MNSRHQKRINHIWRRRQCQKCQAIFTTFEAPETQQALVFEGHDGQLEPFSRERHFISVYSSLRHRPEAEKESTALVDTIMGKLLAGKHGSVVTRSRLVEQTYRTLQRFDRFAGFNYLAYHPKDPANAPKVRPRHLNKDFFKN